MLPLWPQILVCEGLHPFHDERVRKLMDFHVYLDISDEVKESWKLQRDMQERGHSEESIKASIAARKPDFDAYIDPQKQYADVIIQVCTWLSPACIDSAIMIGPRHACHALHTPVNQSLIASRHVLLPSAP